MIYWTIMLITALDGPMAGTQMNVLYTSYSDCLEAAPAVNQTLKYEADFECIQSDTASGSIRPKARPING